jgi:hypothetical protein
LFQYYVFVPVFIYRFIHHCLLLRAFEKNNPVTVSDPKREEMPRGCRKSYNE